MADATNGRIMSPEQLERYANALVRGCVGLKRGELFVAQGAPPHREYLVAIAEAAYRAGARHVEVVYGDPRISAARVRYGSNEALGAIAEWTKKRYRAVIKQDAAVVTVIGETDPGVYDGVPNKRLAEDSRRAAKELKFYYDAGLGNRLRWAGVAWPTEPWAKQVYPDLPALEAQRKLGQDLLRFCRVTDEDGPGYSGWTKHVRQVAARTRKLTRLKLERLELRGPGTELDVKLAPGTRWMGGVEETAWGQKMSPNMPTEESFTSPDPRATEGTFRCSLPLSFRGRLIEGIRGEFRNGRLVRLDADSQSDRDFLASFLDIDENGRRLGEVALVDNSSRIGQERRTYFNTLIDENAAAHIAFGGGFGPTREPGARSKPNDSPVHVDVMIGTPDFEVTGVAARGRRVPLLAGGDWQL